MGGTSGRPAYGTKLTGQEVHAGVDIDCKHHMVGRRLVVVSKSLLDSCSQPIKREREKLEGREMAQKSHGKTLCHTKNPKVMCGILYPFLPSFLFPPYFLPSFLYLPFFPFFLLRSPSLPHSFPSLLAKKTPSLSLPPSFLPPSFLPTL